MLSAPNGETIHSASSPAGRPSRMEGYWDRVTELTQKIKGLEAQLQELQEEAESTAAALAQSEATRGRLQGELDDARAQLRLLSGQLARAQAVADQCDERVRQETASLAAELAEMRAKPVPPSPRKVQKQVLAAFDVASRAVRSELAAGAGAGGGGDAAEAEGAGQSGDKPAAAAAEGEEEAEEEEEGSGCSIEERAEQYLREAMEGAVRAVEPARLEAVGNWQAERRRRRLLQNQLQELKGSIRVMCRVRPTAAGEGAAVVTTPTPTDVLVAQPGTREGRRSFAFDQAFGPGSGQEAVFEEVEPCVESVLDGFNVCIFAYGQTGSGKTFTMEGSSREEGLAGINPRALRRLFEMIAERKQLAAMGGRGGGESGGWEYAVSLSYLEIYNENLRDLLGDVPAARAGGGAAAPKKVKEKASLDIRSTGEQVQVLGLSSLQVSSADEVEEALRRGGGRRSVAATKCNASSSRSHSICVVTVTGRQADTGATTHGKLHLVDLAGSERVKKSDVSGQGMLEAQAINKSLSALGNVMAKLQEKAKHVPFRDSKLTQLLADSLGGNSKTFMFVNINPSAEAASESLCSLEFGMRVRKVELGRASGRRVEGASLAELKEARGSEERAISELRTAEARLARLEGEAKEGREAQAAMEAELAELRQRKEADALLLEQGADKQRTQLADERKRAAATEAALREARAKLEASEAELRKLRSDGVRELASAARELAAPARPVSQEAAAALRQSAAVSLGQYEPSERERPAEVAAPFRGSAVNLSASIQSEMGCPPAAPPAAKEPAAPAMSTANLLDMDSSALCAARPLLPEGAAELSSLAEGAEGADGEAEAAAPRAAPRRSPRLSSPTPASGSGATPSQRYTPSHLVRPRGSQQSSRKVKFRFSDEARQVRVRLSQEEGGQVEEDAFPAFALDKEDRTPNAAPPPRPEAHGKRLRGATGAFKFEPLGGGFAAPSLGRAFAGGAARRPLVGAPAQRGGGGGAIAKVAGSRRHSSISAHVQRASSRRASVAPAGRRATFHAPEWK